VNDNVAVLHGYLKRGEVQQIADDELAAQMCDPIESRRTTHQATDIQMARA
jgi:hypothetical protein